MPCALRGPKVHGDTVQCSRCLARRYFGVAASIVPSVQCDAFVQPVGREDDLASWQRLGAPK
jgi:hypothetical protein